MKKFVYQIYPLSFYDANRTEGKGNINGIIQKLDYIKSIGIDYIWLCPIFKTNFKDNGYDVIDYYEVDPIFGKKEDLINLINEAKKRNIKIMLDMVFNHVSTSSEWFVKALKGDEKYKKYFILKETGESIPNNWVSKFGGPAWSKFDNNTWYLHLFDKTQADLNWDNDEVREELKKVLRHYINLGVKGFRFDVINLISKSSFQDDQDRDGRKFYTDGINAHKYIQEISKEFSKDADFLTVGELSSTTIENTIKYSNKDKTELDSAFTFHHLKVDYEPGVKFTSKKPDIKLLNDIFRHWVTEVSQAGSTLANFFNNHDQPRSVSRFIEKEEFYNLGAKMLFALTTCLPGISYIYQGEEIGMTNPNFDKISDYRDVETINYYNMQNMKNVSDGIKAKSRDNSRTPMQWDSSNYSGFSNVEPWIPVNNNYKYINVKEQVNNPNSVLSFYKDFINFSKNNDFIYNNNIEFLDYKENTIRFYKWNHDEKYLFIFNLSDKQIGYNINPENIIKSNYLKDQIQKNKILPYQFIITKLAN